MRTGVADFAVRTQYEGEWYGRAGQSQAAAFAKASGGGAGGKRTVRVLRVGEELEEEEVGLEGTTKKGGGLKRRRWRV